MGASPAGASSPGTITLTQISYKEYNNNKGVEEWIMAPGGALGALAS
jgi:hypothetical protein